MVWVGRDLKDHLVSAPLPWAGTPSTTSGYLEPLQVPLKENIQSALYIEWNWTYLEQSPALARDRREINNYDFIFNDSAFI